MSDAALPLPPARAGSLFRRTLRGFRRTLRTSPPVQAVVVLCAVACVLPNFYTMLNPRVKL